VDWKNIKPEEKISPERSSIHAALEITMYGGNHADLN
jgi:hypothetical protein